MTTYPHVVVTRCESARAFVSADVRLMLAAQQRLSLRNLRLYWGGETGYRLLLPGTVNPVGGGDRAVVVLPSEWHALVQAAIVQEAATAGLLAA